MKKGAKNNIPERYRFQKFFKCIIYPLTPYSSCFARISFSISSIASENASL